LSVVCFIHLLSGTTVLQVVEYLLRNRASLSTKDSLGRTALHHATTDDVKTLLQAAISYLDNRTSTCWLPGDDVSTHRKYDFYPLMLSAHVEQK